MAFKQEKFFLLTSLEQIKVLADPLRMRILEQLGEERTTKQVADLIGEKPTRLYHHVEALERIGVIRQTRTKQNRGTIEKYFQTVALAFKPDPDLFNPGDPKPEEREVMESATNAVLENTAADMRRLIASADSRVVQDEGVLSFIEVRGTQEEIDAIRKQLDALLEDQIENSANELPTDGRRFRLTIAYFPLDRSGKNDPEPTD